MIHEQLRALRKRTPLSIRAVADLLGYEAHSKYAYYESPRFKGPLPMGLVAKLANLWAPFGVLKSELYVLAGVGEDSAVAADFDDYVENRSIKIKMSVLFPPSDLLTAMFKAVEDVVVNVYKGSEYSRHEAMAEMFPLAFELLLEDIETNEANGPDYPHVLAGRLYDHVGRVRPGGGGVSEAVSGQNAR